MSFTLANGTSPHGKQPICMPKPGLILKHQLVISQLFTRRPFCAAKPVYMKSATRLPMLWASFLICFFGATFSPLYAQLTIIGTANGSNSSTDYPSPYAKHFEGQRTQYLYLADELNNAMVNGPVAITSVGFLVSELNDVGVVSNLSIRMGNTLSSSLDPNGWENNLLPAFDTLEYEPGVGVNRHQLQIPFIWDGFSNLVIEVCSGPTSPELGLFSSANAGVSLTQSLPFNGSRTYAADDTPGICYFPDTNRVGAANSRPILFLITGCFPPQQLSASDISSNSVQISWSGSGGPNQAYQAEIGPAGFTPGQGFGIDTQISTDTTVTFSGLNSLTFYEVYVRSNCGGGSGSDWIGPLQFLSGPGCGDPFNDTGGAGGAYSPDENYTVIICADNPNENVRLTLNTLNLGAGDTLSIQNGFSLGAPVERIFTGPNNLTNLPPFVATTATGCLRIHFSSDASDEGNGWSGNISCAVADSCYTILGLNIFNIKATSANFSWEEMFDAEGYEWKIGVRPYTPVNPALLEGNTMDNTLLVSMLPDATFYDFYIRGICNGGDTTGWQKIAFFTPPECNNVQSVGCSQNVPLGNTGTGVYNDPVCNIPTPGKEDIFRFTAPNTRNYTFNVVTVSDNTFVGYFYKPVALGCGPDDWECIDDFNQPGSSSFGPLIAGTEYFIRYDAQNPANISAQTVRITDCSPTNDRPENAIFINVGEPCAGNVYSNTGASIQPGEPDPDADPSDGLVGRWQNDINRTVWFSFIAPASGTIRITTEIIPQGSNYDTQIALYTLSDLTDFSTFRLLESDEDSGNFGLGFNGELTYTGLLPDDIYYIQVDGYGVTDGTFCIVVEEAAPRTIESNCSKGYAAAPVNGLVSGGDRWYNLYSQPSTYEIGELVAAIKPGPQNLDSVFCQLSVTDTVPLSGNNPPIAYMPAYYRIRSSQAPVGPVTLRLFYYNSEFDSLKTKANAPAAVIENLNVSQYTGPMEDCIQRNNNYDLGLGLFYTNVAAVPVGTSGTFYLEFTATLPGEFGAHLGLTPLPLELAYFQGRAEAKNNILEWETRFEKNVATHIVERSLDGLRWESIGQQNGQLNSNSIKQYQLRDDNPPALAYYRLRSVDVDGKAAVSQQIALQRSTPGGIQQVTPVPTNDFLNVTYVLGAENDVTLRLSDLSGRVMLEQNTSGVKGLNNTQLDLLSLPAGMYLLSVIEKQNGPGATVRVVKQ